MQSSITRRGPVRQVGEARAARASIAGSRAILLDWDGCVALGNTPQPEAIRFIAQREDEVAIVSNNSTDTPEDFARVLLYAGARVPAERIVLAGTETLAQAARLGAERVLIIGDGRMKAYGRRLGLNIVQEDADLVVLLRDTRFTYARLQRAANALVGGARLLVANPDLSHPGAKGAVVPETGALLAALLACAAGTEVRPEVIGKPSPALFQRACGLLRVSPAQAVMIGDNPDTDIAGATALGLDTVLIGPRSGLTFADLLGAD